MRRNTPQTTEDTEKNTPLFFVGLVTGIGSALSGTGGPLLLIPIIIWFQVPVLTAIGLSQIIQIPISTSASFGNFIHGQVDIQLALILAVTMVGGTLVGGTLVGAKLVHHMPIDLLKKLVACLLIAVGVMMLIGFLLWLSLKNKSYLIAKCCNGTPYQKP